MPLVSVALAVYNGEKYLEEQVQSILNQSVKDIEVILNDDCSTDGSWNLMQRLANTDKRISVYKNSQNMGFKRNFEQAISHCTGDYVALSDDDDIWEPDHIETLLQIIGNKALACGNSTFVDANGKPLGMTLRYQEALDWIPDDDMKKFKSIIIFRNPYQGATMLLRRDFLEKALPIPDDVDYHDTWLASIACFCGGISYTKKSLMKYRRLETSVTGLRNSRKSKLWRLRHPIVFDDRIHIIRNIDKRLNTNFTKEQKVTIKELSHIIDLYHHNHHDLRFPLYELLNYKTIFSCDLPHWI